MSRGRSEACEVAGDHAIASRACIVEHDRNAARVLLEAFKQATFGHEEEGARPAWRNWIRRERTISGMNAMMTALGATCGDLAETVLSHGDAAVWQVDNALGPKCWRNWWPASRPLSTFKDKSAVTAWQKIQEQVRHA